MACAVVLLLLAWQKRDVDLTSEVRLIGRVQTDETGIQLTWAASGIELDLEGRRLEALISDGGQTWLDVSVDGKTRALRLREGARWYKLVDAPAGVHRVRVSRRTEPTSGPTTVQALRADGPATPTPAPERRILVIGDSISVGYGVEGADRNCAFSYATENADLAYAALAARELGADVHVIAISGRGVVLNYGGFDAPTMLDVHRSSVPGGAPWSPEGYRPGAVVVHLGTNDFGEQDPGEAFVDGYVRLLSEIEQDYPEARVYAGIGPMLGDDDRARARAGIERAIRAYADAGGDEVELLSFDWASEGRVFGCDWHPGVDTQALMARQVASRLEQDLGWTRAEASR